MRGVSSALSASKEQPLPPTAPLSPAFIYHHNNRLRSSAAAGVWVRLRVWCVRGGEEAWELFDRRGHQRWTRHILRGKNKKNKSVPESETGCNLQMSKTSVVEVWHESEKSSHVYRITFFSVVFVWLHCKIFFFWKFERDCRIVKKFKQLLK